MLSAGALITPTLLMRAGIGHEDELRSQGSHRGPTGQVSAAICRITR